MRRPVAAPLALLAALALSWVPPARADEPPPPVRAKAVLVADGVTGEVLYERDADRRLPQASITKLMTVLVALDRLPPGRRIPVVGPAPTVGESTINLERGERMPVRDLVTAALVQSANDAAYALAAYVGGGSVDAFVDLMNDRARELGLDDTHFVRPDGLDTAGHYSSARDVFALARIAMENPVVRRAVRREGARIAGGRRLHTWNDLLGRYAGTIGVKTGHTDAAGWSEVAAARRAKVTPYAVILGSPSRARRNADLAALLDWAFAHYAPVQAIDPDRVYAQAALPWSDDSLALVAEDGATPTVRLGRPLVERVVAPRSVDVPIEAGEQVGEIVVTAAGRVVARRPLVASRTVEEPGLPDKVGWYAGRALDEAGDVLAAVVPG